MERSYEKASLLTTSSAADVLYGPDSVTITGLNPMRISDINNIFIKNAKAETAQVVTIGGTTDPTIAVNTKYIVGIKRISNKGRSANFDDQYTYYKASIATSTSAAVDRQAIYDDLTEKINADTSNGVVAAAGTGGNAMTITDDGSYYSGYHNAEFGGNGPATIKLFPDTDGTGFVNATHLEITTAAVRARGTGALLQKFGAGQGVYGHLVSEAIALKDGLSGAATGQLYTEITFESLVPVNHHTGLGAASWKFQYQEVFVDNGAGSSTSNLAGYNAFLEEVEYLLANRVVSAPNAAAFTFQKGLAWGVTDGTIMDGAALQELSGVSEEGSLISGSLATSGTIMTPQWDVDSGLTISAAAIDDGGFEIRGAKTFTAGSEAFSIRARISIADVSDTDGFGLGIRKQGTVIADWVTQTDFACLGLDAADGNIDILTNLNGAGVANTDTTLDWADTEEKTLEVRVDVDGKATFFVDDVEVTSVLSADFTFDSGDELTPFAVVRNAGANDAGVKVETFYGIPSADDRNA